MYKARVRYLISYKQLLNKNLDVYHELKFKDNQLLEF